MTARHARRRLGRAGTVVVATTAVCLTAAVPAAASWLASRSATTTVSTARFLYPGGGAAPTAPAVQALTTGLRVSFDRTVLSGTVRPATSYVLLRYAETGSTGTVVACPDAQTPGGKAVLACDDPTAVGVGHRYTVRPRYARWAGAESASSTLVARVAPPAGVLTPAVPTLTAPPYANAATVSAYTTSGTAAAGSTVTVTLVSGTSTVTGTTTATSAGTWTLPLDASVLPQGAFTVSATAGNAAGTSAAATATPFKDTVAPAPVWTTTSPSALVGGSTTSATPALSGTAGRNLATSTTSADAHTVTLTISNGTASSTATVAQTDGSWTHTTSPLADLTYTVVVRQTDAAGNTGTSAARGLVVEAATPTASGIEINNRTGTVRRVDAGDEVVMTYSERIDPSSLVVGWDGTTTLPLSVRLSHVNGQTDRMDSWTVTGALLPGPALLGWVDLRSRNFFNDTGIASATLRLENPATGGSVVTVRLTTIPIGVSPSNNQVSVVWYPSELVRDLAGKPVGTSVPATGKTDVF